jgi:hypothetical protein
MDLKLNLFLFKVYYMYGKRRKRRRRTHVKALLVKKNGLRAANANSEKK